jgi:phage tail-like protein
MRGAVADLPSPHPLGATLPGVYQDDALALLWCEAVDAALAPVVSTLDSFSAYLDPATVPEDMLRWLASWVLVAVDDLQRPERRRSVIASAAELHRWRGTARGIADAVEAVFDRRPEIEETGGSIASEQSGSPLPGTAEPLLTVRLALERTGRVEARRLDAIVAATKPAHVPHRVELTKLTKLTTSA